MDIDLFRDLARLAETGNFTQAARLSHLSQPAFSRRIKALEAWVGARLVDRERHPVRLTPAGAQMLEAGTQALARIEHERAQILEAQALPDACVVIFAAQHSIGWRFYPAWLQGFEAAFGPILSRLRADDLPSCLADLAAGAVDFVIAYATEGARPAALPGQRAGRAESLAIGTDRLVPVSKPREDGTPLFDFTEPRTPFLRFGDAAPIGAHLEPLFAAHGLGPRLAVVYENSMAGALRMRAREGGGVAWLPQSLVAPDIDSGALVRTGAPDWEVALEIRLLRDPARTNRLTQAIWTFLQAQAPPAQG